MSQYLFLFSISPVQSFIAQARKTQDLYAGSFILSYLIDFTMKKLEKEANVFESIFPKIEINHKPNRFIAKIETDDVAKIGKTLEDSIKEEYLNISQNIAYELNSTSLDEIKKQIETYFQINWVAVPLKNENYSKAYNEIESYLGSIKNIRNFKQLEETGRKCSLCGERNVLFFSGNKRKYTSNYATNIEKCSTKSISDGEGLCSVCTIKRFGNIYFKNNYIDHFPSTAEIALMDSLDKIDSSLLKEYRNIFGNNFDSELFYSENLTDKYFQKNGYPSDILKKEKLKTIEEKLKTIEAELPKYYAIISIDGDNMGKWLSGEFLQDKTNLFDFHKKLTEKLSSFAKDAENIVKEHKGQLVYAGGDDVLAFSSINAVLSITFDLRKKFPKFEELGFETKNDKKSSASAGIVLAHYKMPLSEVLNWSRKMEKEAKSLDDQKDAFSIAVLKRSGEIRKTKFKMYVNDSSIIEIFRNLIDILKKDYFSNTFIKNLDLELREIINKEDKCKNESLVKTEINRLIKRSFIKNETAEQVAEKKKQIIGDLQWKIEKLYSESNSLENFLSSLEIADFMARRRLK